MEAWAAEYNCTRLPKRQLLRLRISPALDMVKPHVPRVTSRLFFLGDTDKAFKV